MGKKDDWCIVRWHSGELLVYRQYQWAAQGKHYPHKWVYVVKNLTEQQARDYSKLF